VIKNQKQRSIILPILNIAEAIGNLTFLLEISKKGKLSISKFYLSIIKINIQNGQHPLLGKINL